MKNLNWQSQYDFRYLEEWREPIELTIAQIVYLEKVLKLKKECSVLEIACGYGRHAIELAKRGYNVLGIDHSTALIEDANQAAKEVTKEGNGIDIRFIQDNILGLDYKNDFDAAYMLDMTFGLFDDEENQLVLRNIAKALKPGGKVLLEMFNPNNVEHLLKRDWHLWDKDNKPLSDWNEDIAKMDIIENSFDPITGRIRFMNIHIDQNWKKTIYPPNFLRVYTLPEVKRMLQYVGMKIIDVKGDTQDPTTPFSIFSLEMVVIAQLM